MKKLDPKEREETERLVRQAGKLAKLIGLAEREVKIGQTRAARDFLKEFKHARRIQD